MATKQEFRTYMEQNKANLNQEALKGADMNMVYNEWRDTGSISKNYINQPVTQQPVTQVTQQPNTQVQSQVQPRVEQQITPQVESVQTKAELPQTPAPKTTPTTEVKPGEAPTLETPKYQQQLDKFLQTGSIAEARNKLKEGLANGTIDKATYDKAESYLVSNLYKKEETQTQEQAIQNEPNNLFNSLRGGQTISNDILNTTEGKQAQSRFRNLQLLESKTPNQIASLINGGLLNVGSQVYNDLKTYNPELLKQAENIAKMQVFTPTEVKKDETGKEITKTENTQFSITEKIMELLDPKNVIDVKTSLSQDEKINELNSQLSAKEAELKEKKRQIDNVYRDLEKQLSGTGATKSYIQAKASRMAEDLIRDYNTMQDDYNIIAGDLNRRTEMITYDVQRQEKERQSQLQMLEFAYGIQREEQAYQRELEKEERMRGYTMEDRQYQEELQQRQLEQQYAYQYGDLNSDNPTLQNIAIERAVASMYENYPIPGMESQSVKVQKVKNLMAQGMTGTQAIAQVESEIRNSQRYKDYIAYERARITPQAQEVIKMGEDSLYNPATGQWITKPTTTGLGDLRSLASQFPGQAWAKNNNPAGITWNTNFDKGTGTAALLREAGINYSKGTARPANEGGNYVTFDTIEDGLAAQRIIMTQTYGNSTVEQMLSKWVGTGEALNYAKQVAGNAGVNLKAKVSSLSDDQISQLQMAKIQKESPGLFSILQGTGGDTQYTQDKIELLAEISQIQSETEKRKALEGSGFTLQDLTKYKADASAGRIPPTEAQIQASLKTLSDIQGIAETDWTDATGKFDISRLVGLQDATNAGVLIENLRDVASFNNLGMLKGPMSDKDIAFLKSVSSKLDPVQSNKQFEKNIVEMYNIAARKAGVKEITKLSEIPKERILPGQGTITGTSTQTNTKITPKKDPLGLFDN